jgi:hypothetical protein
VLGLLPACGDNLDGEPIDPDQPPFEIVVDQVPEALLSIGGSSSHDVWAVGADRGRGPLVMHHDGSGWTRHETGTTGGIWWVHAVDGQTFFGGENETLLRHDGSTFERMATPGVARYTVYGVWGPTASDLWAVGAVAGGRSGFVWRYDGEAWRDVRLPADVPRDGRGELPGFFKVWGDGAGNVWVVGGLGSVLRFGPDGASEVIDVNVEGTLLTVHGSGSDVVMVGGMGSGTLLEADGGGFGPGGPPEIPLLQGIHVEEDGHAVATGFGGEILERTGSGWQRVVHGLPLAIESLHAVWIDPDGGVWAVGGNVLSTRLDAGVIVHRGAAVEPAGLDGIVTPPPPQPPPVCAEEQIDPAPKATIARRWNEQILGAIRRDIPRPGVHARNLFHLSAAMWDAWAAYDPVATQLFVDEKLTSTDVANDRFEAISYAAYRVLTHRYATAIGGPLSATCFDAFMDRLGFDPADTTSEGTSARALGNRIGAAVIAAAADDGANEADNYADPDGYEARNAVLFVDQPGTELDNPSAWQPLNLAVQVTQNGIPIDSGDQVYIGSQWGQVTPFAISRPAPGAPYFEAGDIPVFGPDIVDDVVAAVQRASQLDPGDGELIDISPGSLGNNPLGTNDGAGHPVNPVTGEPYQVQTVPRADFGRTLAEFWADGPLSETPPGHWNVLANDVTDAPGFERRLFGQGAPLDPLEWDVKMYVALNGALHDAAIAAWEVKRLYESARPISLVRYMAGLGQRTDPDEPAHHPDGLPLIPDLIEMITEESSAPGQRHAGLAPHVGELAIRSWRGEPGDRDGDIGGCDWIRAVEWIPYQRRTFVTPAFPGFISGHSTFSRAAAEVLAEITGSPFFPGGLGEFVARQDDYLVFERGPSIEVRLQWGTYYDAADQAGQSRIWGGIHIDPDDFSGRRIGSQVGLASIARARQLY